MAEKNNYYPELLSFLAVDLFSLVISFILSYGLRFGNFRFFARDNWTKLLLFLLFLDIIITLMLSPYYGIFRRSYYQEIFRCLQLTLYNLLFASIIFYLLKIGENYSRLVTITAYVFYFFISLVLKYVLKKLIAANRHKSISPLFIYGTCQNIDSIIDSINAGDFLMYDIRGICLPDEPKREIPVAEIPVINNKTLDFILENNIREVILALPPKFSDPDLPKKLTQNGISVYFDIDSIAGFHPEYENIRVFGVRQTLGAGEFSFSPEQRFYLFFKRVLDVLVSLIGCLFLLPISLAVKAAYLLDGDHGNIFFTQTRIGLNGKPFRICKFRSMVMNADDKLKNYLTNDEYRREWEENQKLTNDPRITRIGRFLRKTSFDELPQMLNILRGDMSLVGPRPLVEGELELHNGLKLYQKVKPGITGWWGCNGRSNISYPERLELEYYYVKHISPYLDFLCIFRTFTSILKLEGAK